MTNKGNFNDFLKAPGLNTSSLEELRKEVEIRERQPNPFPLEVFNDKIKPYLNILVDEYDIPKSYIGLSMLSAYSTSIGNAFHVSLNRRDTIPLVIWACMEGISSSGKSLAIDITHRPIYGIQSIYDREWDEKVKLFNKKDLLSENLDTIVFRDSHIPTLVRTILPDNSKGVLKHSDEILEWLNSMNQLGRKEGADEQIWLSSWSGRSYSGYRAGKDKFVLPRPYINVIGGVQPTLSYRLFANDRDSSGFIFRLLFAVPDVNRIASPNPMFRFDKSIEEIHSKSIRSLFFDLPVVSYYDDPRLCVFSDKASSLYQSWESQIRNKINQLNEIRSKEIQSGIFGKIKEYCLRFSAILLLVDKSYSDRDYWATETVEEETMERAIKLSNYFYESATELFDRVTSNLTAPIEVVQVAGLIRLNKSYRYIAENYYGDVNKHTSVRRWVKKWLVKYPRVFNAIPK